METIYEFLIEKVIMLPCLLFKNNWIRVPIQLVWLAVISIPILFIIFPIMVLWLLAIFISEIKEF